MSLSPSDSDETRGSDSDVTLPPEDDRELYNQSPDLFADYSNGFDSDVKNNSPKPNTMKNKKRHSKAHELSDSESESEYSKPIKSTPIKGEHKNPKPKSSHHMPTDSPKKAKQKSTNGSEDSISQRRRFVASFLDMSDTDSDDEQEEMSQHKKTHKESKHVLPSSAQKPYKKDYSKPLPESSSHKMEKTKSKHSHNISGGSEKRHKHDDTSDSLKRKHSTSPVLQERRHLKHDVSTDSLKRKHSQSPVSQEFDRRQLTHDGLTDSLKRKHSQSPVSQESDRRQLTHDGSTDSLKRKHSQSPVPHKLRKAVTDILMSNENNSAKKKLPPCKYGSKCYRKNPSHFQEFSHDSDKTSSEQTSGERRRKSLSPPRKKLKTSVNSPSSAAVPGTSRDSPSSSKSTHSSSKSTQSSSKSTQSSKSPSGPPKSPREVFDQAQPYSILLTKVAGIADRYNNAHAMDIKDILSPGMGNLKASCQFNYMHDIPWLMKQYPAEFRSKPLLIVHGEQGPSKVNLQAAAMAYTNVKFCQAKLEIMYGTHHTKMMLLLYDTGMRVVIHTSNLIQQDWYQKTQGIWISPVFPRLPKASKEQGDSPTHFKRDLLAYISAYKAYQLKEWLENIEQHDMSAARVVIIGSIPGRHVGESAKSCWGHLKLKKILQQHGPSLATVRSWPVIGQFSSIGSMGPNKDNWLCGEFLQSLSATKSGSGLPSNARLQLVFPSKDNVRLSLEGFPAGGSIPYSVNTAKKQTWLHDFFHVWKSEGQGRSRAMPHIKSYVRPNQNGKEAAWFLVTSSNLSKAAWGALEKKGAQLMIRSYEIGVLVLPKFFNDSEVYPITTDVHHARTTQQLALPFDIPVHKYEKKDRPWMWDIPYMDLPDTNGNVWCPFSK